MIVKRNKDLAESFRKRRRTTEETKTTAPRRQPRNVGNSPYDSFKYKYNHLEEFIDNFGTRDFVYYFREVSEECGFRYTVSNIKKDMAIFKRLRENYDPREICGMIEFLFRSEQDYLDKDRLSPNLLASQWVNTIYADTQLWLDDKYVNKSGKTKKKQREWSESKNEDVKIGGWEQLSNQELREKQCEYCKTYLLNKEQTSCSGGQCSSAYEMLLEEQQIELEEDEW